MNKKIKIGFISYAVIVLAIILLDQMLKLYVYNYMFEGDIKDIPFLSPFIQLTYKLNHGIITGYIPNLNNWKIYFLLAKIITICFLVGFTYYEYKSQNTSCINAIMIFSAFIVGGAISNTIDWVFYSKYLSFSYNYDCYQFFNGSVIDMLKFPFLEQMKISIPIIGTVNFVSPIFNIADCFITLGSIVCFFIYLNLINNYQKNTSIPQDSNSIDTDEDSSIDTDENSSIDTDENSKSNTKNGIKAVNDNS